MGKPHHTTDGEPPDDDRWDEDAPKPIDPKTGQHRAYWVLPESERAKGFVRPLRHSYLHVGPPVDRDFLDKLRDLTAEEQERYRECRYVKFEEYGEDKSPLTGRFWTQKQLDGIGGCGTVTTMGNDIAETYARQPNYYGSTFCFHCKKHFAVEEFVWENDRTRLGS